MRQAAQKAAKLGQCLENVISSACKRQIDKLWAV